MAKKKSTKQRKQIKRETRKFQLRVDHSVDAHVKEVLDYARSNRREVTLIRDAVTLFWALEQGDLAILFEMFPQYKAQFNPSTAEALAQFMEILKKQQHNQQQAAPVMQLGQGAPRVLEAAPVAVAVETEAPSAEEMADDFLAGLSFFD